VPIEPQMPGTSKFSKYTGIFISSGVWIVDKEEGLDLYNCGFYGKGILSRGGPSFYESGVHTRVGTNSGFHIKQTKRVKISRETTSNDNNNNNNNNDSSGYSKTNNNNNNNKNNPNSSSSTNANTKLHKEYLQLSLAESFFLMYGLGCLRIVTPILEDSDKMKLSNEEDLIQSPLFHQNSFSFRELSIKQCWVAFCESQHKFPYLYAVYHHYRTHGWTPKSGLKYGTDFVLYRQGPSFYHAQHTVVVIAISEKDVDTVVNYNQEDQSESSNKSRETIAPKDKLSIAQRALSWGILNNLNRVSEQVAKGLVICYVVVPDQVQIDTLTPLCLQNFKILEVSVSRWLPTRTRD